MKANLTYIDFSVTMHVRDDIYLDETERSTTLVSVIWESGKDHLIQIYIDW